MQLPEPALILLIGPSGSGKSTFAKRFFRDFEVLRSDHFRELLSNSENTMEVSEEARECYKEIGRKRLARSLTTVIDATNVTPTHRQDWLDMATAAQVPIVALVFSLPEEECLTRNRIRSFRTTPEAIVYQQLEGTRATCQVIGEEGFDLVHIFRSQEEVNAMRIERSAPTYSQKYNGVPYDIIGDIHGSLDNLIAILRNLGYVVVQRQGHGSGAYVVSHPENRTIIFLDPLTRQCASHPDLQQFVQDLLTSGIASMTG